MANYADCKYMVWLLAPRAKTEVSLSYSNLAEAVTETEKLELSGYRLLRIRADHAIQTQFVNWSAANTCGVRDAEAL
jgi:hypothetical protein